RPSDRNTSSKAPLNLVSRSRIRKRRSDIASPTAMARLRACWTIHAPLGCAVTPTKWTLWVLADPFVAPAAQNQGVGRALLEHTLAYAKESEPGLIVSSPEPRAIRRYASAGFALHPTVVA